MRPKVSVILPCYNGAELLPTAIQSCIDQTFKDWELIIVNDCSKDNSLEVAQSFAAKDKRIKVYSNEVNKKLPATLNAGFSYAQGDYYTWTSDDNIMHPEMLEDLSRALDEHPNAGLVVSDYNVIDEKDQLKRTEHIIPDVRYKLCLNNYVGCSFMYRKEVAQEIGEYNVNLFLVEDYEYWLRISFKYDIYPLNKVLYSYREHPNSLTSTRAKEIAERLVNMRITYKNQIESLLKGNPKLLALFYYRVVDNLHGAKKRQYLKEFFKKMPYNFGFRYLFVHLPHKFISRK